MLDKLCNKYGTVAVLDSMFVGSFAIAALGLWTAFGIIVVRGAEDKTGFNTAAHGGTIMEMFSADETIGTIQNPGEKKTISLGGQTYQVTLAPSH